MPDIAMKELDTIRDVNIRVLDDKTYILNVHGMSKHKNKENGMMMDNYKSVEYSYQTMPELMEGLESVLSDIKKSSKLQSRERKKYE